MCPPMRARWRGATWRIRWNLCFLKPTWVHNPNGKSNGSAIFTQLMAEAHLRNLANTTELVLHWAHPSPQPKWEIDQLSRFCTAHGRKSLYFTIGARFPQNCPFPWAIWTPFNTLTARDVHRHLSFNMLHTWWTSKDIPLPRNRPTSQRTIGPAQSLNSVYWIFLLYCNALWLAWPSRITDNNLKGHCFLGPTESSTKTASWILDWFIHFLHGSLV